MSPRTFKEQQAWHRLNHCRWHKEERARPGLITLAVVVTVIAVAIFVKGA